jgi:transcriptional regulator with XRE-family HTH domain
MDVRRLVGWNIRRIRVERDLSIEALAGEAELEPSYLGKVERAAVNSSIDTLAVVARCMGVPIQDLFQPFPPGAKRPRPLRSGPRPAGQRGRGRR